MLKSDGSESAAVGYRCHTYAYGGLGLGGTRKGVRRRTELEKLYNRNEKDSTSSHGVGGESIYDATNQETERKGYRETA